MTIEVEIDDPAWTGALPDAERRVEQAGAATLVGRSEGEVAVLLTSDAAVHDLNRRFRGKDQSTNVLSFPAGPGAGAHLGDVALAFGVCAGEAAQQGKSLADHVSHLVVHGVLHLLGYDHLEDREAEAMEALERDILAGLGVADPYRGDAHVDGPR